MIDHFGCYVSDMQRSRGFYLAALEPLGIRIMWEVTALQTGRDAHVGFGDEGAPKFWIGTGYPTSGRFHLAFAAKSRAQVDGFYRAAMANGGRDNGAPGVRAHYHPDYYSAFVLDPDGYNIEAVCRRRE